MTTNFKHTPLGRTIALVKLFDTMPDETFTLCKAFLCGLPNHEDPINVVTNAIYDTGYLAHVMDRINRREEYNICTYMEGQKERNAA